ncbi:hypothetical protein PF005_g27487 [Phytophthora fragariae]|uniref:RxLR effector protein n=2 Tax=Phytophthora TaxID=4783 RepID=A0A6A3QSV9_9STRA|nr:hypothetical protein PF003_g12757 [Phytophthora fragariae]KAE8965120.1 hypothetical protein PR002_g28766 [Phytophthora rubi]KAE8921166.1 hypothetical protein PF009_g28548 [Phytophthora fragariae]KAE8963320.1 hypothetical protein PF011_g29076 [Phytophthora fragariae]KAE9066309.1 hypothetical protein PF010_g27860 [Phytophthora fragariae]
MRLHYALLLVVAVLATCSSVISAAEAVDDVKLLATNSVNQAYPSGGIQTDNTSKRFLRTSDTKTAEDASSISTNGNFIEHKLQRALTNPKKTQRLYKTWYQKGYTAKDVANQLGQDESRELKATYQALYTGYAVYAKEQQAQ